MKAHVDFYAELFSRDETDISIQNDLLSNVMCHLSDSDRELCEGDLLLSEATADGLTAEFYIKFWDRLGSILVEVFNQCLHDSNLCDSMKTALLGLFSRKVIGKA